MNNKQRSKDIAHYKSVIKKYNKIADRRPLTSDEQQQVYLAEAKIEELYGTPCNGNCNPTVMSYDMMCLKHGWL